MDYATVNEVAAYEDGYKAAVADFQHQLERSRLKILAMQLDTEPFTSQRRMLMACTKLLEIYSHHYQRIDRCKPKMQPL